MFSYDIKNAELFSQQISQIKDKKTVLEIKKALEQARNLYNIIRLSGQFDFLSELDFKKLNQLYNETAHHLDLLNLKDSMQNNLDSTHLLNAALETVLFMFRKISEAEMVIADQLKDTLRKTREALASNFDQQDPKFISLYEELKRLFNKKNLDEITQEDMKHNIAALQQIFDKVTELNRKNNQLKAKYKNDVKYARIHKRIIERGNISKKEVAIGESLMAIKQQADDKILIKTQLLNNDGYFSSLMMTMVIDSFDKIKIELEPESAKYINSCLVKEYINEYQGIPRWY
ncbi:MAG: hypothetical protein QX189_17935 [Methylococcales bacterium]